MRVKALNVLIDRDITTHISKQIWPWELPVLQAQFGEGKARVVGTEIREVDSLPSATDEFSRMSDAFGFEEDTNESHVHIAYGRGQSGIAALKKAINSSKVTTRGKKVTRKKSAKPEPESKDPLS